MFLPIREGIAEVLHESKQLHQDTENMESWAESFGNQIGRAPRIVMSSTPDMRKRPRELTVSLQDTAAKKPEMERPKASPKKEEWVEVPLRKNLWKKEPKLDAKKPDCPRRAHPEAVLIKPAEGVSYTAIFKNLKKNVKPDELGVTVHGIRKTCSRGLLLELKCSKEGRGWLDIAL